jgi:GTA TIM-barrel-like domain/Putative phage tail protein
MATIALQIAGTALGTFLGGPIGGAIGSALGGTLGAMADRALLGGGKAIEGPRLSDLTGITATEGAPIPRAYGRVRLGGQVIWATEFEEQRSVEKSGTGGGKSTGAATTKTVRYSYFANVAIGLCEGPIHLVRRIWADGEELDLASLTFRTYTGSETQDADPLIIAKQQTGAVPAFRGLAYVVFERLPLSGYGNRLPQFTFEVVRAAPGLPDRLRAINLMPGSTEFGYATGEVREEFGLGSSQPLNRAQWTGTTDWEASLDALTALTPALERVTLISAWFGSDLRPAYCTLQPKVEKNARATSGQAWQAAGLTRETAAAVSEVGGRPSFGGSPSDQSVIDAIRDLRRRGLKVALHPFILMDIPPGNTRPNPLTGAIGQPAYPWRGRITCVPAQGRWAASLINTQIASFTGTVTAAQFALSGDTVVYSGPAQWSFRRMLLHHAMLAKAAGGVDTFIMGSELVGLTRYTLGGGNYFFVQLMLDILPELRSILGPQTIITYAADWSEYGADVRSGGLEVRFPLDPLWAHPEIGAIGIDFYPPLTDWRNGRNHLDAALARSGVDADYIAGRITSGEAFDWYYANATGRAAQQRLPITDGTYAKPWVFRQKDLKSWWSQQHVERQGGVELAQSTAFIPQGKPIYLTEIGCPAVDKGANQPNVFPDPKSIENALPYFSSGSRDDLVQRRVLEAFLRRFDPASPAFEPADNPLSAVYSGRMIDPSFIAPWAYDARPYPAFPMQRSLWADGTNWVHGHWLNGRLEALPVDALIAMIATDMGVEVPAFEGVDGIVDGYVIDRPMSARAAIEPVAAAFGLSARASGAGIRMAGRPVTPVLTLTDQDLVPAKDGALIDISRRQESELPRQLSFGYIDGENGFRQAVAVAETTVVRSNREQTLSAALHLPRGLARQLAETRLQDIWGARETMVFRLRPNLLGPEPGDLVSLPTASGPRLVQITRITDGSYRECEARAYDPHFAEPGPTLDELPPEPGIPALPGAAHARLMELPLDQGGSLLSAVVRADPWRGPYSVMLNAGGAISLAGTIPTTARVGTTLTPLPPGPLWRWDEAASLDILVEGGALSSLGAEATLAGGNALALAAPSPASRLLSSGADAVLLDDAVTDLGVGSEAIGAAKSFIVLPAGRDPGDSAAVSLTLTASGVALMPLSPVRPKARREAGGVRFSFIRRTRKDGDSFDLFEVPLGEETEEYRFEIMNGTSALRSVVLSTPEYLYPAASELADFGTSQASLAIRVRQVSRTLGPGAALIASVPVL